MEMPELGGIGVLETIKADMGLREIPVVVISGKDDQENVVKCIELGAEDFLRKPFDPILLTARLAACLEKKQLSDQKTTFLQQIRAGKKRADDLLNVILPSAAASELKSSGTVRPRRFDNVAVLFCDIVGFTAFCDANAPEQVVSHLEFLFQAYEEVVEYHEMEKIKTIGDNFMASAGLMRPNSEPLLSAVRCGLRMAAVTEESEPKWQVRVGVHSGPVVAGVVGRIKYQFDLWGDTVNVAARMTELGAPGTVTMSHEAWLQVESSCEGRSLGNIEVKGKGKIGIVECYATR